MREFVAFAPFDLLALIRRLPAQCDSEACHGPIAAKVHTWTIFIRGLVVALRDIILRLLCAPLAVVAAILVSLADRERRYANARQAELVGPIVVAGFGARIRHDAQTE